jgi:hypothetical protein
MKSAILALALAFALATLSADLKKGQFGAAKTPEPAPKSTPAKPPEKSTRKSPAYPFHGTLGTVDPDKKTLTLRGKSKPRVILLTPETRIQKNGLKAGLADGIPGERVTGSVRKNSDGKEEALTVHFGEKKISRSP